MLSLPAPAAFGDLSLQQRLPCHTGVLLGWMAKEIVSGRESPAEVAAVSSEETKQLFAVIPELSHHLLCSKVALQFSFILLSFRLEELSAFHLGAMTQGLCHLSCFPPGFFVRFV